MISRDVIHLPTAGLSVIVSLRGKLAKIAFAFCNPRDSFNRKIANQILDGRIENNRNLIQIQYLGNTPRRDVLFPIADFIRQELGYLWDEDSKRFYHPETFGVPVLEEGLDEMDVYEPDTRINRSVTQLTNAIRQFVDENLRPTLEAPFQRAPSEVSSEAVVAS